MLVVGRPAAAYHRAAMECDRCGADNAEQRRYCRSCGAPLLVGCPACGFANEPEARFCGGCGRTLGPASPPETERRQVAVLFLDLVGFTRLTSELGAEATRAVLGEYFTAVDEVITRHGGTVDKHIGDCVMALFGAPVALGDDVARAVRAALASVDAMPKVSARLGRELQIHGGIATGDVVAGGIGSRGAEAYTVTGETVNLASRLADLAEPGEILVSDEVRLALGDGLQLDPRSGVRLDGVAQPVTVHRLRGIAPAAVAVPLVGRDSELAQLVHMLERTRASGRGGVVVLRGEAGIGKTRLLAELQARAEALGFTSHAALVLDFGSGEAGDPIRVLSRSLAGEETGGGDGAPPALVDLLGSPLSDDARHLLGAMSEAERRSRRQEAFAGLLRSASAQGPLLITVEDLHWADAATLADLAAALIGLPALPVLLVLTTRRDGDPIDTRWLAQAGHPPLTVIELGPLPPEDSGALVRLLLTGIEASAVGRCVARAQGNPLFLDQLARHVREGRDTAVPASVQTLTQARLDRLPPSEREAVRAASVLGQRFSAAELAAVLGRSGYNPAMLVERSILRPAGEGYLFAHALIRDAVYDLLLAGQRRELHRRAATWFAARDPVLHAEHLDRAGDPDAPAAYATAARHLAVGYRASAGLELALRGAAIATVPEDRLALAFLIGQLQLDLGDAAAAEGSYRSARELTLHPQERAEAALGLATSLGLLDRLDEALEVADAAEADARAAGNPATMSRVHHLRGNLLFPLGEVARCAAEHENAVRLARGAGSAELEARALGGLGDAAYAQGRMASANSAFRACCALACRHGLGRIEAANLPMVAVTSIFTLELKQVREEVARALDLTTRVGHHRSAAIAHHAGWIAALLACDLAACAEHAVAAAGLIARIGARRFEAENLLLEAEGRMLAGDRTGAAELAARALQVSRETALSYVGPAILGMVAWATDDQERRRAAIDEAEALLATSAVSHNHFFFRRYAIEAAAMVGDWTETSRHADALEAYAADEPSRWSRFFVGWARALAAHGRAQPDAADLRSVRAEAVVLGVRAALPAIDAVRAQRGP